MQVLAPSLTFFVPATGLLYRAMPLLLCPKTKEDGDGESGWGGGGGGGVDAGREGVGGRGRGGVVSKCQTLSLSLCIPILPLSCISLSISRSFSLHLSFFLGRTLNILDKNETGSIDNPSHTQPRPPDQQRQVMKSLQYHYYRGP